ncbi:MAG: TonB-dependent receptor, partial [Ferruginibacter sp.]
IPALKFKYSIGKNTQLELTSHMVFGERSSVQFINAGNIPDTFNLSIGSYNPRQVDRDFYNGFATEVRLLQLFQIGKMSCALSGGLRYFTSLTKRRQKGTGTIGSDFDLSVTKPFGIDLRLNTNNYAFFAENMFKLNSKFTVTPGIRYEIISTNLSGVINSARDSITYRTTRNFPLFGVGLQYELNASSQLYTNISQAYRPYLYANVTPADRLDKIDPSLQDSKGYDIDIGYRGHYKNILQFEIDAFYLFYGNRIGLIKQTNAGGADYLYTTNIGNSVTKGFEVFAELSLMKLIRPRQWSTDIRLYNSLAYNSAKYTSGIINQGGINKSVTGNYIENAPAWVNKSGLKVKVKNVSFSFQYSYSSKIYNDAFNTESSSNGVIGVVPAYHVWDWSGIWQFTKQLHISASISNLSNEKYFNRRITMYPGPGILPADGRTFNISVGAKF